MTGAVGYDDVFARATQLFVPALLEAADIAPGHDVLDVATGTGIAAAAAHAAVGPSGTVVAGDISPAMLDIARVKLRDLPVVLQVMDAHLLPYADCRFDAVICQLGLMLFAKPARALAEFHRVLRPGGRASVTVSTVPQRTLFLRVAAVIARHVPARAAELARHFNIVETEDLRGLLAAAGFRDVRVESERREFQFASFEDYFAGIENGATLSGQEFVRLPAPVRSAVRDEVRRSLVGGSDGPFAIPMEVLIGSGRR
jgi:ubiquinone/menaquinone biosynthesis C-methylase UbiE